MELSVIAQADAIRIPLPDQSVHCAVTSPPYWGLRKYAGDQGEEPLGLESTPERHIKRIVEICREVRRVLRDDGVFWLNYGDCYGSGASSPHGGLSAAADIHQPRKNPRNPNRREDGQTQYGGSVNSGLAQGSLMMMPHRVALALQQDGWIVRQDLVWFKRNPMPESIAGTRWVQHRIKEKRSKHAADHNIKGGTEAMLRDASIHQGIDEDWVPEYVDCPGCEKCIPNDGLVLKRGSWRHTRSHEFVFQLVKGPKMKYWSNQEAVRETLAPISLSQIRVAQRGEFLENTGSKEDYNIQGSGHFGATGPGAAHRGAAMNLSGRNPRSVLDVPTAPYRGAHYACVDEETEALTPDGWKRHNELKDGELIAAYDIDTDLWKWETATVHRYDFDGQMVLIEKRETSQLLTPNHRCIIRRRAGHQGRDGWKIDVVLAANLKPGYELMLSAPKEEGATISIGRDWAALVGWYITDGYRKHDQFVGFSQSLVANPDCVAEIRALLKAVNADFSESRQKREWRGRPADMAEFVVRGPVADRLMEYAPKKKMTPILAALPIDELHSLFGALVSADGSVREDGRFQIIQKDKESLDLMQLVALRLGYKAIISKRKGLETHDLFMTGKKWLTLRGANGKHEPLPLVDYKGTVWCPSVPTGFWIARRNGRAFITGNTFPPNLIAPLIRATCHRWACPVCGQGWAAVVDKKGGRGHDWNTDNRDGKDRLIGGRHASESMPENYAVSVLGYRPTCEHEHTQEEAVPGIVFDPFVGSGTTVAVAKSLLRRGIGIDISMEYLDQQAKIRARLGTPSNALEDLPLFENLLE